tara:strand:- start:1017 stop:2135 length:1119 start_codon:yes stop_codon:yes gene_type:complete
VKINKRVVVHVGPPKTGTSAIQNWCVKNTEILNNHGIYYPPHEMDNNGISSGHLRNTCDIREPTKLGERAKISFSEEKFLQLMNDFEASDHQTLLLSSEFFIQYMSAIRKLSKNVTFVAYLRNPIEIVESNYNQGVKRSGFTHTIGMSNFNTFPHFSLLKDYLKTHDDMSLSIRLYKFGQDPTFNLIQNFLAFLGIEYSVTQSTVNNSYSFEALEFKRWINSLSLSTSHLNKLDSVLQRYDKGVDSFSLIPPDKLPLIKSRYIDNAEKLRKVLASEIVDEFIEIIESFTPGHYKKQEISKGEFIGVLDFVCDNMKPWYFSFSQQVLSNISSSNSEIYAKWAKEYYKRKLTVRARYAINQALTRIFQKGHKLS